ERTLAREQLPAPLRQGILGAAQTRLRRFDQEASQVLMPMTSDATTPLGLPAIIKSRIKSDVFDEFLGFGKALDIANESAQSEGYHFANTAQPHNRQEFGIGEHLL